MSKPLSAAIVRKRAQVGFGQVAQRHVGAARIILAIVHGDGVEPGRSRAFKRHYQVLVLNQRDYLQGGPHPNLASLYEGPDVDEAVAWYNSPAAPLAMPD
jgi:hypothetical protein